MNVPQLDPEKLRSETSAWQQQTIRLMQQLGEMRDIDVGTASKDVVYEEEKIKLYRYQSSKVKALPY